MSHQEVILVRPPYLEKSIFRSQEIALGPRRHMKVCSITSILVKVAASELRNFIYFRGKVGSPYIFHTKPDLVKSIFRLQESAPLACFHMKVYAIINTFVSLVALEQYNSFRRRGRVHFPIHYFRPHKSNSEHTYMAEHECLAYLSMQKAS